MGMDLHGKQGYFRWTNSAWQEVLDLALRHGWEPEGTRSGRNTVRRYRSALRRAGKRPEQVERAVRRMRAHFHRSYGFNEQQVVTARDAKHLADALERALSDTPTRRDGGRRPKRERNERTMVWGALLAGKRVPMLKMKDDRRVLRKFIAYCRGGRFEIW